MDWRCAKFGISCLQSRCAVLLAHQRTLNPPRARTSLTVTAVTRVLLVTGPVGVGKSAVLREADQLLIDAQTRHATVELEEIARCWPAPAEAESRQSMILSNLAALWSNFAARGADRLLLAQILEHRSQLQRLREAIPESQLTVVRLHAPLSLIEERIRRREPNPEEEQCAAGWLVPRMDALGGEDHVVENCTRPLREVASEVLRVAGWLP